MEGQDFVDLDFDDLGSRMVVLEMEPRETRYSQTEIVEALSDAIDFKRDLIGLSTNRFHLEWNILAKTDEAAEKLREKRTVNIGGKVGLITKYGTRKAEIRVCWLPIHFPGRKIIRVLSPYGKIIQMKWEKCLQPGLENLLSGVRSVVLELAEGVSVEDLPGEVNIDGQPALFLVKGRVSSCSSCRTEGLIYQGCPNCGTTLTTSSRNSTGQQAIDSKSKPPEERQQMTKDKCSPKRSPEKELSGSKRSRSPDKLDEPSAEITLKSRNLEAKESSCDLDISSIVQPVSNDLRRTSLSRGKAMLSRCRNEFLRAIKCIEDDRTRELCEDVASRLHVLNAESERSIDSAGRLEMRFVELGLTLPHPEIFKKFHKLEDAYRHLFWEIRRQNGKSPSPEPASASSSSPDLTETKRPKRKFLPRTSLQ